MLNLMNSLDLLLLNPTKRTRLLSSSKKTKKKPRLKNPPRTSMKKTNKTLISLCKSLLLLVKKSIVKLFSVLSLRRMMIRISISNSLTLQPTCVLVTTRSLSAISTRLRWLPERLSQLSLLPLLWSLELSLLKFTSLFKVKKISKSIRMDSLTWLLLLGCSLNLMQLNRLSLRNTTLSLWDPFNAYPTHRLFSVR